MAARYDIIRSFEDRYHFRLMIATRVLLIGGEKASLALCRASISSVRLICDAPLEDCLGLLGEPGKELGFPKYNIERRGRGTWTVYLFAKNGRCVAQTPPFSTSGAALDTLEAIKRTARYGMINDEIGGIKK